MFAIGHDMRMIKASEARTNTGLFYYTYIGGIIMQLLVLILKKVELLDPLLKELAKGGVKGGTIVEGTGMAEALVNMEDLPMFGVLRRILKDEEKEISKMMFFVCKDDEMIVTRDIIKRVIGDLKAPNTGIMFAIPITYVEGLM